MIVQFVKFKTNYSEDQVMAIAKEREPLFQKVQGLQQKYYVKIPEEDAFGGIYIWDNKDNMIAFRSSELAASIPKAYGVIGAPEIQIMDLLFTLKD